VVGRNILIVDDDEKIVDLVQTYLKKDDYRVLTAYNGLRALELARQKRPDLIVLDLMLPGVACRRSQHADHYTHRQDYRRGQARRA